jgi:hypothetical protein
MMQKQIIVILLSFIYIVNGYYEDTNCKRFENKIYQITITFPGGKTFYVAIRLLPNGQFDDIYSIAGGKNAEELSVAFAFSTGIGNYKCLPRNYMRLTEFGYLYKTDGVSFLQDNGADGTVDFYLRFSDNDKTCKGVTKFAAFKSGTNPFTTNDPTVFESPVGNVTCELFQFRAYSKLSGV